MADFNASTWSEMPSDNDATAPNGFPTGQNPNTLPDSLRVLAAAGKNHFDNYNAMYATTGTATALVLTRVAAPSEGYQKGLRFTFFPNATNTGAMTLNINSLGAKSILRSDGSALVAGDVANGLLTEVYYDGTAFKLLNGAGNVHKGDGAGLVNLNGSNIATGTVADARLPTSMAGKTFTSPIALTNINGTSDSGGVVITGGSTGGANIELYSAGAGGAANSIYYDAATHAFRQANGSGTPTVTIGGNTAWHAGNFDPNSKASLSGATFTGSIVLPTAGGTNAITVGTADGASYSAYNFALKGWYGMGMRDLNDTVTGYYDFRNGKWDTKGGFFKNGVSAVYNDGGTWGINVTGTSGNSNALGGRASSTIWDNSVNGWKYSSEGQQRRYYASGGRTYFDSGTADYMATFRFGNVDKLHLSGDGNIWMTWANDWLSNLLNSKVTQDNYATYWNINVSGSARLLQLGNNGTRSSFNWAGQGGQPTWLWGGNDPSNMYVYNPSNFSVNYANTAGNANAFGGIGPDGYAKVPQALGAGQTTFPIGSYLLAAYSANLVRRATCNVWIYDQDNYQYTIHQTGALVPGTWVQSGYTSSNGRYLVQRIG